MKLSAIAVRAVALATTLVFVSSACGGGTAPASNASPSQAAIQPGGTLKVIIAGNIGTLDPHNSGIASERDIFYQVFDPLVRVNPDLTVSPALAESWKLLDPTTLQLTIRSGVKFHDGTPADATAVKWNLDRILDKANKLSQRTNIESIASVEAKDAQTVVLHLGIPDVGILARLGERPGMMISPTAAQADPKSIAYKPVGTGPFEFVDWVKDSSVTLKKNANYWEKPFPYVDRVEMRIVTDSNQKVVELQAGNTHVVNGLQPKDARTLRDDAKTKVFQIASLQYGAYYINVSKPPMSSKPLRQALAWSLDRDAIIRAIYLGEASVAQGPYPPSFKGIYEANPPGSYSHDIAKAKQILKDAGLEGKAAFTLTINNEPTSVQLAELMQAQAKEAGIEMKILSLDVNEMVKRAVAKQDDATFFTFSGRIEPDFQSYEHFRTGGPLNYGGYSNPVVDQLLIDARKESDVEKRNGIYKQINRILLDDSPRVFTHYPNVISATASNIAGYKPHPDYGLRLGPVGFIR